MITTLSITRVMKHFQSYKKKKEIIDTCENDAKKIKTKNLVFTLFFAHLSHKGTNLSTIKIKKRELP